MIDKTGALRDLLYNLRANTHHFDARVRVYPQVAGETVTLISDGVADTFGAWTVIVPINIIGFDYKPVGAVIDGVSIASSYFIQIGYTITDDATPPTTAQILGEREKRITDVPIAQATELLDFYSRPCLANSKLWGRLKTDGGATDEAYITVAIVRHVHIIDEIARLTTWPWHS